MNFEFFIAQRMRSSSTSESTVSGRIIKIAVLAIAMGLVMILIAIGTSLGMQREIKAKIIALSGDIRIAPFENNNSSLSVTPVAEDEISTKINANSQEISHAYPFITKAVLLKTKNEFEGAVLKGVTQRFPWEELSPYRVEGVFPYYEGEISKDIVLSATIARKLNLSIGDRVSAYFQSEQGRIPRIRYFNLSATFKTGFPDFDDNYAFVDMRHLQRLNDWQDGQIGGYEVFLTEKANAIDYAARVYASLPPHIDVQTIDQLYQGIFEWIALFDFNVLIILIVMILVGTLNMATALLVLILERSRMIGVLKTLGASSAQVQKIFLYNAVYIVSKGLIIGNGLGLLLLFSQICWQWMQLDSTTYFVSTVPIYLPLHYFIGVNSLILFVCVGLLWIPSRIISDVEPSRVLRFR